MERFYRGVRNVLRRSCGQTTKPSNLQTLQTIPDADDTIDIMVCQLLSNLKNL